MANVEKKVVYNGVEYETSQAMVRDLRKDLRTTRVQLQDLSTPMAEASVVLDSFVQRNFKSQGGKVGGWKPFAPSTLRAMERRGRTNAKLLQDSGALRLSFIPFVRDGVAGIGSKIPYARYHEEGTATVPKRRMLPKRGDVMADIKKIFKRHANKAAKAAKE